MKVVRLLGQDDNRMWNLTNLDCGLGLSVPHQASESMSEWVGYLKTGHYLAELFSPLLVVNVFRNSLWDNQCFSFPPGRLTYKIKSAYTV